MLDRNPVTRPTNIKELKSYKDKSIHFAMISTLLASAGIYTPFVNLVRKNRNYQSYSMVVAIDPDEISFY